MRVHIDCRTFEKVMLRKVIFFMMFMMSLVPIYSTNGMSWTLDHVLNPEVIYFDVLAACRSTLVNMKSMFIFMSVDNILYHRMELTSTFTEQLNCISWNKFNVRLLAAKIRLQCNPKLI